MICSLLSGIQLTNLVMDGGRAETALPWLWRRVLKLGGTLGRWSDFENQDGPYRIWELRLSFLW
jgi:hypothetical protein